MTCLMKLFLQNMSEDKKKWGWGKVSEKGWREITWKENIKGFSYKVSDLNCLCFILHFSYPFCGYQDILPVSSCHNSCCKMCLCLYIPQDIYIVFCSTHWYALLIIKHTLFWFRYHSQWCSLDSQPFILDIFIFLGCLSKLCISLYQYSTV